MFLSIFCKKIVTIPNVYYLNYTTLLKTYNKRKNLEKNVANSNILKLKCKKTQTKKRREHLSFSLHLTQLLAKHTPLVLYGEQHRVSINEEKNGKTNELKKKKKHTEKKKSSKKKKKTFKDIQVSIFCIVCRKGFTRECFICMNVVCT